MPVLDETGNPTGEMCEFRRDEGLRETSREALAKLRPVGRPDGMHTAGNSPNFSAYVTFNPVTATKRRRPWTVCAQPRLPAPISSRSL